MAPDGTFRLMYSTNGDIVGPWSTTAQDIYFTQSCPKSNVACSVGYNYASHAYPDIDPTGKVCCLLSLYDTCVLTRYRLCSLAGHIMGR
jgi:hypothetical protein